MYKMASRSILQEARKISSNPENYYSKKQTESTLETSSETNLVTTESSTSTLPVTTTHHATTLPSVTTDDTGSVSIEEEMTNRVKRLKRTCSLRRKIQNFVDQEDYDSLIALHDTIYDVTTDLPSDDTEPAQCNTPSYSKSANQARFIKARRKSHIDIFYDSMLNVTICLPPKCGTTNWQNALATLRGKKGRAVVPNIDPADYADCSKLKKKTKIFGLRLRTRLIKKDKYVKICFISISFFYHK